MLQGKGVLLHDHRLLTFSEPKTVDEPYSREDGGDDRRLRDAQGKRADQSIRPRTDLIAGAIDRGIDESLSLIAILAAYHGEQNLTCRPREREIPGATDHLEGDDRRERWEHREHPKTQHAQGGQQSKRNADAEPAHKASSERYLDY